MRVLTPTTREVIDQRDVVVAGYPSVRSRAEAAPHPSAIAVRCARTLSTVVRLITDGTRFRQVTLGRARPTREVRRLAA